MNNKKTLYEIHKLISNDEASSNQIITKIMFSGGEAYKIHQLRKLKKDINIFIKSYTVNDCKSLIR